MDAKTHLTQLHLGLGSFHRAHQAVYLENLNATGDTRWQIVAGNIRPDMTKTIDALIEQDGRYTLETVSPRGDRQYQLISSIKAVLEWDEQLSNLIRYAKDPNTRIISFTVTEAGYYLDQNNQLEIDNSDISTDLKGDSISTIYGALTVMLWARMNADSGSVTLMNCDNLRENGKRFAIGFKQFLIAQKQTELLAWVNQNTSTPNGMVDRITPRPTEDIQHRVKQETNMDDKASLMGEEYIQWVLENDFINDRPEWEKVGVELVNDVRPYEEAKIRILNASHSCIAWAGVLKGYDYIHEGAKDPEVVKLAYDFITDDVIPSLKQGADSYPVDLEKYRDTVLDRFSNEYVKDTNPRVAMDGFSKIPGFILPTIEENLKLDLDIDASATVLALFLAFLVRLQRGELNFKYEDQNMNVADVESIVSSENMVSAYVNNAQLFGVLAGDQRLLDTVGVAYDKVQQLSAA